MSYSVSNLPLRDAILVATSQNFHFVNRPFSEGILHVGLGTRLIIVGANQCPYCYYYRRNVCYSMLHPVTSLLFPWCSPSHWYIPTLSHSLLPFAPIN